MNSARGWSRLWRAYAVEAGGLLGCASLFYFALLGPLLAGFVHWFETWGFLAALVLIPVVEASALVVLSVRLRVAPVGLVNAVVLGAWGLVDVPTLTGVAPRWGIGLALAPMVAALVTHPWGRRPGRPRPQVWSSAR